MSTRMKKHQSMFIRNLSSDLSPTTQGGAHLLQTIIAEIGCEGIQDDKRFKFLKMQLFMFMEANGPGSIFSNDSYEQILFNALFRMLKRLSLFKEKKLLNENLSKVMKWFEVKIVNYKDKTRRLQSPDITPPEQIMASRLISPQLTMQSG